MGRVLSLRSVLVLISLLNGLRTVVEQADNGLLTMYRVYPSTCAFDCLSQVLREVPVAFIPMIVIHKPAPARSVTVRKWTDKPVYVLWRKKVTSLCQFARMRRRLRFAATVFCFHLFPCSFVVCCICIFLNGNHLNKKWYSLAICQCFVIGYVTVHAVTLIVCFFIIFIANMGLIFFGFFKEGIVIFYFVEGFLFE